MARYTVTYARTVVMQTIIEADSPENIADDGTLPEVYDGLDIPPHVQDVTDDAYVWDVEPLDD